jgi:hypothetical protein
MKRFAAQPEGLKQPAYGVSGRGFDLPGAQGVRAPSAYLAALARAATNAAPRNAGQLAGPLTVCN